MKMAKKIVSMLLALILVVGMAACGGSGAGNEGGNDRGL